MPYGYIYALAGALVFSCPIVAKAQANTAPAQEKPSATTGVLLDPDGKPLAGVSGKGFLFSEPTNPGKNPPMVNGKPMVQPVQQLFSIKPTDENGRFTIDGRAKGVGSISYNYPPYATALVNVELPAQDIKVQLQKTGATVKGLVKNATTGQPAAGAHVVATPARPLEVPGIINGSTMGEMLHTETAADGSFSIDRLPEANCLIDVRADGLVFINSPGHSEKDLKAGEVRNIPDLLVYPGHTLTGRILDKTTGQPVPGGEVKVGLGFSGAQTIAGTKSPRPTYTDESGVYTLTGMQPWKSSPDAASQDKLKFMFVTASAPGYGQVRYTPEADRSFDSDNLTIHHDFELPPLSR